MNFLGSIWFFVNFVRNSAVQESVWGHQNLEEIRCVDSQMSGRYSGEQKA